MHHGDKEFVDFVIDQIGDPLVVAKGMFGGFGLYRDGQFFGIVFDGVLYLKTNSRTRHWFVARGMEPFRPSPKQTLKTYYEVPEEIMDQRELLHEKAEESWRIAGTEKF